MKSANVVLDGDDSILVRRIPGVSISVALSTHLLT